MSDKTTDAAAELREVLGEALGKAKFVEQFTAAFLRMIHPDDRDAWRPLAGDIARSYWDDPDQRAEGPDECAEAEISTMREDA